MVSGYVSSAYAACRLSAASQPNTLQLGKAKCLFNCRHQHHLQDSSNGIELAATKNFLILYSSLQPKPYVVYSADLQLCFLGLCSLKEFFLTFGLSPTNIVQQQSSSLS